MIDDANLNSTVAHLGYSDEELERLCGISARFESGIAPWAAWEPECRGAGKAFRKWACYPAFLPLYFSADHGVNWASRCWPNEVESKYKTFFTWNKKKNDLMKKNHGKNSYHVPHPWLFYRKKYFPTLPKHRSGTLVFYAHSNSLTTTIYEDLDKYISDLKSLPEKYQPIVICLADHDVKRGLHKELRKYKIPLVTAGASNSQKFVDRFYSLLYQFRFSSSPNIGSHTFYIIEAGVPFFLYGPYPEYHIKGSKAVADGKQNLRDYGDEEDLIEFAKLKELLSVPSDEVTPEQYAMASKHLGMDSQMTRFEASLILWRELFLHSGEAVTAYAKIPARPILRLMRGLASKIKSLIDSRAR